MEVSSFPLGFTPESAVVGGVPPKVACESEEGDHDHDHGDDKDVDPSAAPQRAEV